MLSPIIIKQRTINNMGISIPTSVIWFESSNIQTVNLWISPLFVLKQNLGYLFLRFLSNLSKIGRYFLPNITRTFSCYRQILFLNFLEFNQISFLFSLKILDKFLNVFFTNFFFFNIFWIKKKILAFLKLYRLCREFSLKHVL